MKAKPWNDLVGMGVGAIVGALMWWGSYVPGQGLFQNPDLFILPAVCGLMIVNLRNRWRKVGPYDPETIARNKRGRY